MASELFVYPQVKDVDEVHIDAVVDVLVVKKIRGEISFTKDMYNKHLCTYYYRAKLYPEL